MKIAIITPIGDMARFGYQYTAQLCLDNQARFSDRHFVIQSMHPAQQPAPVMGKTAWLDNEAFWFPGGRYDLEVVHANRNEALRLARVNDYDVAITLDCNWYIPLESALWLRRMAMRLLHNGDSYGGIYVRYQLGDRLTGACAWYPYMINLRAEPNVDYSARDGIHFIKENSSVVSQRGHFFAMSKAAVVDAGYELGIDDLKDRVQFRGLRSGWDWDYWYDYYLKEIKALPVSFDKPSNVGVEIAKISAAHPHFLSQLITKELGL